MKNIVAHLDALEIFEFFSRANFKHRVTRNRRRWDKVLSHFAREYAFAAESLFATAPFSPQLAAIGTIYVAVGRTERNEISKVERCGTLARVYLLSHGIPPPSFFILLAFEGGEYFLSSSSARGKVVRAAICLLACDKSILLADVRDAISDPRTFTARTWYTKDGRGRAGDRQMYARTYGETYGHDLIGRPGRPMASYCRE